MKPWTAALVLILALGTWSLPPADSQQAARVYRVGQLAVPSREAMKPLVQAVEDGLRDLGYVTGRNLVIEYRFADGKPERLPELTAELVRLNVDVIVTGVTEVGLAAKRVTTTVPIVLFAASDPVRSGLVASVERPGGNVTGLTSDIEPAVFARNVELLKEAVPGLSRLAILGDPSFPGAAPHWKATEDAARRLGLTLRPIEVRRADALQPAFATMARDRVDAVIVFATLVTFGARNQITALALQHRVPALYMNTWGADAGGLMAYGLNLTARARRSAAYIDRILKGANPAELAMEPPARYDLVINLKAAQGLGLTIPPSLLQRADRVIQ
jgi:putative ABC transport system substrate-binding protein